MGVRLKGRDDARTRTLALVEVQAFYALGGITKSR